MSRESILTIGALALLAMVFGMSFSLQRSRHETDAIIQCVQAGYAPDACAASIRNSITLTLTPSKQQEASK